MVGVLLLVGRVNGCLEKTRDLLDALCPVFDEQSMEVVVGHCGW